MGNNQSTRNTAVPSNQQSNTPDSTTPRSPRKHNSRRASSSSHMSSKRAKPSSRRTVHRDYATVSTILSRYANRLAIEKVLKENLGESLIAMADGTSAQQWRIEEAKDETKRIYACRELTKVEQQAIYRETHRRREGTKFNVNVRTPEYN